MKNTTIKLSEQVEGLFGAFDEHELELGQNQYPDQMESLLCDYLASVGLSVATFTIEEGTLFIDDDGFPCRQDTVRFECGVSILVETVHHSEWDYYFVRLVEESEPSLEEQVKALGLSVGCAISILHNQVDDDLLEWLEEQEMNRFVVTEVDTEAFLVWIEGCDYSISIDNILVLNQIDEEMDKALFPNTKQVFTQPLIQVRSTREGGKVSTFYVEADSCREAENIVKKEFPEFYFGANYFDAKGNFLAVPVKTYFLEEIERFLNEQPHQDFVKATTYATGVTVDFARNCDYTGVVDWVTSVVNRLNLPTYSIYSQHAPDFKTFQVVVKC
ncbi:hypothetical protein ACFYKX_11565 [Cytobacillus sp. FJAT-54145]|uniref:Uncharacterized protein n=1 Tax=Cytobacillus spartinae TaxID=3299023 RepID=A0ABW6KAI9_9BACI